MLFTSTVTLLAAVLGAIGSPVEKRSVPQTLLDEFTRYAKYASSAYQPLCPHPLGNTLVNQINQQSTNTQLFIARDDTRREIVVSFRGSLQPADFLLTDLDIILIPFQTAGVTADTTGALAHQGWLNAYNSVASQILSTVTDQLASHPSYTLVSTGHSLGGALASIGAVSLKQNFPSSFVRMFTYGQPRTGNQGYADLVEQIVGVPNLYRSTLSFNGVPTLYPRFLGYHHHAGEFWNFVDGPTAAHIKVCSGQEDPTCSDSIPTGGINLQHLFYFGEGKHHVILRCQINP
ncbi:alpha/beta-hydrolase [Rickenella mellea]|uniref:Alpha/beta-hydrolase n=1 Tax=Rickenella mellea TaxID=50990 RepID=A0A4Y7PMT0_9AGAM|nr:alpha/beta-hydrolase [Rickenella mellea]